MPTQKKVTDMDNNAKTGLKLYAKNIHECCLHKTNYRHTKMRIDEKPPKNEGDKNSESTSFSYCIFFLSANNTKVIMHINILCFENEGHHIHKMGKRE